MATTGRVHPNAAFNVLFNEVAAGNISRIVIKIGMVIAANLCAVFVTWWFWSVENPPHSYLNWDSRLYKAWFLINIFPALAVSVTGTLAVAIAVFIIQWSLIGLLAASIIERVGRKFTQP